MHLVFKIFFKKEGELNNFKSPFDSFTFNGYKVFNLKYEEYCGII